MMLQIVFFAALEQEGSFIILFAQKHINLNIFSHSLSANFFHALNPAFTFFLGPLLVSFWGFLGKRNIEPSSIFKIGLAFLSLSLGFGALILGICTSHHQVSPYWLIIFYFFHALGEFFFAPASMSIITVLAPPRIANFIMGIWLLSLSFAYYLAGIMARFANVSSEGSSLLAYAIDFKWLMGISFIGALILGFLSLTLKSKIMLHSYGTRIG